MSFIKKSTSAIGKLLTVAALAAAFLVGMVGVVYLSLQGEEIKVPEIVGKDLASSEQELEALGLRIKKRADRYSTEKPNTVLEQLPKAGETVKTGQMILVVTSKANPEGQEDPATIKKTTEEEDIEKIEELISDKPKNTKKSNSNVNTNKKKATTRDVLSNNSNSNTANSSNSNKAANDNSQKGNKNGSTTTAPNDNKKPSGDQNKPPTTSKTPNAGDSRQRRSP